MNPALPLSKSGVVWALAVLEEHVRQNFFIYKPSAWQMARAGTFQARNHAATGTLPPLWEQGWRDGHGASISSCPLGTTRPQPLITAHLQQGFHGRESLWRRHGV